MLHIDVPTPAQIRALRDLRADACVSIYLPTTPLSQNAASSPAELRELYKEAHEQLETAGIGKQRLQALRMQIDELGADEDFWQLQARALAVYATPDSVQTYRLANHVAALVEASDRFHLTPLLRAVSFPNAAYVLPISENAVRLVEVSSDLPPAAVSVSGLPRDAASAVGKSTLNDRAPSGRIQGTEGQNVRLKQYARRIDRALRPILAGSDLPLILAGAGRMVSIYRSVCSYPGVLPEFIDGVDDHTTDAELAERARTVLDHAYKQEIAAIRSRFDERIAAGKAVSDLSDAARAATAGAIDTLLVDIDAHVPGRMDELTGEIEFTAASDASSYGLVSEIAARALCTGARVLGVRAADLPGDAQLAAILRYPV